jgi:GMP synthase-like glutamine amidotransferase
LELEDLLQGQNLPTTQRPQYCELENNTMMKPRVLVVQHDALSPLGAIGEHFATDGITPTIIEPHLGDALPDLERFDILVLLGGQMEVWQEQEHPWLVAEKAAIRYWVNELDRPLLGICLGHQLLADALGGRVGRAEYGEAALTNIELTAAGQRHPVYQGFGGAKAAISWHGSEVTALPQNATLLSTTAGCAVSSFSVGTAAVGVQYHIEATGSQTEDWAATPDGARHLERLHGPEHVLLARRTMSDAKLMLWQNSRRFYDNFMALSGAYRRPVDRLLTEGHPLEAARAESSPVTVVA